jgi:hypothetical protein
MAAEALGRRLMMDVIEQELGPVVADKVGESW